MTLPLHKTKIVCTIGPASDSPKILMQLLRAGMDIARLNFSHGDFAWHKTTIDHLRDAAHKAGKRVTIIIDLPGRKDGGEVLVIPAEQMPGRTGLAATYRY